MKEGCRAEARRGGYNLMKKIFAIILISLIFASYFLMLVAQTTLAQDEVGTQDNEVGTEPDMQKSNLVNPIGASSVSEVIGKIIKIFLGIIGTISLIMFIYGGFLMLTSAGRAGQIKTGQQTLVWASIGILVVFTSYAMLKFVFSAFGI